MIAGGPGYTFEPEADIVEEATGQKYFSKSEKGYSMPSKLGSSLMIIQAVSLFQSSSF